MNQPPAVFVSSTFFDLRQVRADLVDFLTVDLGYRVLASEFPSFPIDPAVDTIENCRRRVADADILLLVIGGRYGYVMPEGRSVTNIEYAAAKARKIPIFAFAQKTVLAHLPTWESNPTADFSHLVDTPRLFEFIRQVGTVDRTWVSPFETAQDIVLALRSQFAFLMRRGLLLMSRLVASDGKFDGLSGRALEIAADGADGWEVQLFAQLLRDELAASADAKRLHDVGGVIGPHAQVHESEMISWLHARLNETSRMIADAETILPRILNEALAQNEPKSLAFAARHIAQVYRQYLAWAAQVRGAIVPEAWHEVADQLARIYDESLAAIAATPDQIDHEVERAKETGLSLVRVPLRLNFDVEKLKVAIRRVQPDIQFE